MLCSLSQGDTQLAVRHYELGLLFTPSVLQFHYRAPAALRLFSCTADEQQPTAGRDEQTSGARVQLWLPSALPAPTTGQPPASSSSSSSTSSSSSPSPAVRRVLCPLPYSVTAPRYGTGDEPWRWDEDQQQPDRRGATFVAVGSER